MVATSRLTDAAPDVVRAALARRWLTPHREGEPGPFSSGSAAAQSADADVRLGAVVLRPHQVDAVRQLRAAVDEGGGALLADAVGLGKTFVALALARAACRPLVIAPVGLRSMWEEAARRTEVVVQFRSTESLGQSTVPPRGPQPWDLVIVDEAHHFRNPATRRYRFLARLTAGCRVFRGLAQCGTALPGLRFAPSRLQDLPTVVTPTFHSHVPWEYSGLLLPACGEKVGMRGRFRESELVETPPHRAEFWFTLGACCPLPARGAREAVLPAVAASVRDSSP